MSTAGAPPEANDDGPDRERLVGIAYRMVGSRSEAEDLVQEAVLRVHQAGEREQLDSVDAYATTVLTRLAIDHLRSARVRREAYVGPWLPEPVAQDPSGEPAAAAELADSLSLAFLVVLESLGPVERAALLLHDVFGYGYPEIAGILDRTEDSSRQLVSRARRRVEERRPRFDVDPAHHAELLDRFLAAARSGAVDGFVEILAEDAVLTSDGGAERRAARFPVEGSDRIARFLTHVFKRLARAGYELEPRTVNGMPGFAAVSQRDGSVYDVGTFEVLDRRITHLYLVVNPDKLRWITD
jgi:RNA polymerase sigma-70 factor (ECF subfamily)